MEGEGGKEKGGGEGRGCNDTIYHGSPWSDLFARGSNIFSNFDVRDRP